MAFPLETIEEATPERLTDLLNAAQLLSGHRVVRVGVHGNDAFNSTVAHLELYFGDPERAPLRLLLKLNHDHAGREEVAFYELMVRAGIDTAMLVPCISTVYNAERGMSHVLLLDVSKTHKAPVTRENLLALEGIPTEMHLRAVTEALARFHAGLWEHPLLDRDASTQLTPQYRNKAAFETWWARHQQDYEQFAKTHGDTVPEEIHTLLRDALEHYPKLWERYVEPRSRTLAGLTVTHNDCYLSQFLCPETEGPAYLVDFQSVCTDFAARDLVYLMATFWTREQRAVYERGVLKHYHRLLLGHGVLGYDLEQLFDDYRLMLIDMVFHPVWDTTYGADSGYWWPKLKCLTDAYRDWNCDELFRG